LCFIFSARTEEEARQKAAERFGVTPEKVQLRQGWILIVFKEMRIPSLNHTISVDFKMKMYWILGFHLLYFHFLSLDGQMR
jgi:hypothetical protein